MVQAVTYQSDKQSVYFQGKLIVLENLTPVLSPEEKKKRKREIENNLYDIFSKYKQSFRAVVIDCPHYLSKRAKRYIQQVRGQVSLINRNIVVRGC